MTKMVSFYAKIAESCNDGIMAIPQNPQKILVFWIATNRKAILAITNERRFLHKNRRISQLFFKAIPIQKRFYTLLPSLRGSESDRSNP